MWNLLNSGIRRGVRVLISGGISYLLVGPIGKGLLLPQLQGVPGLSDLLVKALETLSNPALTDTLTTQATLVLTALLSGLIKGLRDKGKLPGWVPL